jgi:NADPH:quinone reductase
LACWSGATVIATVSSPEKAAIARAAGAHHTIDYTREDVTARIMEITSGAGVERIIEVDFGANVTVDAAVIAENGTVASYSSTRVREPVLPYYAFGLKGVRLHFVQGMNMPRAIREAGARTMWPCCREACSSPGSARAIIRNTGGRRTTTTRIVRASASHRGNARC